MLHADMDSRNCCLIQFRRPVCVYMFGASKRSHLHFCGSCAGACVTSSFSPTSQSIPRFQSHWIVKCFPLLAPSLIPTAVHETDDSFNQKTAIHCLVIVSSMQFRPLIGRRVACEGMRNGVTSRPEADLQVADGQAVRKRGISCCRKRP